MLRFFALLLIFLGLACGSASAATCPLTSVQVKDNAGNIAQMSIADDGTGNGTCQTYGESQIVSAIKNPPPLGTTGGWTPLHIHALTSTVTAVKTSAGQLGFAQCDNANGVYSYIQIFNAATGSVTLGVTAPLQTIPIPANLANGFAFTFIGLQYGTAISVAATTTDNGSSAPVTAINCTFGYN